MHILGIVISIILIGLYQNPEKASEWWDRFNGEFFKEESNDDEEK